MVFNPRFHLHNDDPRTEDDAASLMMVLSWTVHASPRGSTQQDKHKNV